MLRWFGTLTFNQNYAGSIPVRGTRKHENMVSLEDYANGKRAISKIVVVILLPYGFKSRIFRFKSSDLVLDANTIKNFGE